MKIFGKVCCLISLNPDRLIHSITSLTSKNILHVTKLAPKHLFSSSLTRLSLQSTPLSQAVDAAISLQYTNLSAGSFNDQVYEIYSLLTDDSCKLIILLCIKLFS